MSSINVLLPILYSSTISSDFFVLFFVSFGGSTLGSSFLSAVRFANGFVLDPLNRFVFFGSSFAVTLGDAGLPYGFHSSVFSCADGFGVHLSFLSYCLGAQSSFLSAGFHSSFLTGAAGSDLKASSSCCPLNHCLFY